jgi:hypothetical protein
MGQAQGQERKIFFVFNTHFDHRGERAREESARLILEEIKRIPVICQ